MVTLIVPLLMLGAAANGVMFVMLEGPSLAPRIHAVGNTAWHRVGAGGPWPQ
ncbi:hypothetical protein [Thermomonospora umbrina]|uniref:hypothetical protein n=1 Tax=Thermomonospora umbrina TaxID=111806 RepID=UPI00147745EF|nr:hypothetical protein [Thermomonospora umbrina]